jgi:hypothetical protein
VKAFTKEPAVFNPISQLFGFFVAITFMSLPVVALTSLPLAAFALLKVGQILGKMAKEEDRFAFLDAAPEQPQPTAH